MFPILAPNIPLKPSPPSSCLIPGPGGVSPQRAKEPQGLKLWTRSPVAQPSRQDSGEGATPVSPTLMPLPNWGRSWSSWGEGQGRILAPSSSPRQCLLLLIFYFFNSVIHLLTQQSYTNALQVPSTELGIWMGRGGQRWVQHKAHQLVGFLHACMDQGPGPIPLYISNAQMVPGTQEMLTNA